MALGSGTRLGVYEILSLLGSGGMGEVYKARDTRLDRIVAVKVLPTPLATDPALRDRFEREARTISQLSHPNICTLHDVGHEGATDFLVLEYLEGESLEARLTKGALPLKDALAIAIQVAAALGAAHRAGVVHRDLKPGNVMLTKSGAKMLDFGLAKTAAPAVSSIAGSILPTTPPNITAQGTILGTFQYMAPEQIEGAEADVRTDIFAFGCVLFEMLTGRRAFEGKTRASLIGAILKDNPSPASDVQPGLPSALDRVVMTCLAKDPDDRRQNVRDIAVQLSWLLDERAPAALPASAGRHRWRERLAWAVAVAAVAAAVGLVTFIASRPRAAILNATEFSVFPPEKMTFNPNPTAQAISPDGRVIVFAATPSNADSALWIRPIDSLTARLLPGTEGANGPFFSPDSRSVAFFARGKLRKVDISGGPVLALADAPVNGIRLRGGAWNRGGVIVYPPNTFGGLSRVSAAGDALAPATTLDQSRHEVSHGYPCFLPDGRHFLFLASARPSEDSAVYVGSLDSNDVKLVLRTTSAALYATTGHLLFSRDGTLMAQPFDVKRFSTTGDAIPVAEHVGVFFGGVAGGVSETGTLIYRNATGRAGTQLVWMDRAGKAGLVAGPPGQYQNIALSRDEQHIAFDRSGQDTYDVWLRDLQRQITSRLTFQRSNVPVWAPDGRMVVFASSRTGTLNLYQRPSNMSAPDEVLLKLDAQPIVFPSDWSADGQFVTYYRSDPKTQLDQWVLPMEGDRKPFPLLHAEFNESQGQFSPDGKWIAYVSDESGQPEIYVQSFPTLTGKWQISSSGGSQPRWRRDGRELFYVAADRKLMAASVTLAPSFTVEATRPLFETLLPFAPPRQEYEVSADGQRFLLNLPLDTTSPPMTVVVNWNALLKK